MDQTIELMLVKMDSFQEKTETDQAEMKAMQQKTDANQKEIKQDTKTSQERTTAKKDAGLAEMRTLRRGYSLPGEDIRVRGEA